MGITLFLIAFALVVVSVAVLVADRGVHVEGLLGYWTRALDELCSKGEVSEWLGEAARWAEGEEDWAEDGDGQAVFWKETGSLLFRLAMAGPGGDDAGYEHPEGTRWCAAWALAEALDRGTWLSLRRASAAVDKHLS